MKNVIRGMMVASALAGAFAVQAKMAAQEPAATPAPAAAQTPAATQAPTVDEIINKHLAAIGGKDAIAKVKSMSMETSVQVMGNEAPNTIVLVDGVGYRSETDFNGSKIIQCYNDKGGWMINPMAGANDPTPIPDEQYKAERDQIYVGGPLLDYAAKGNKVELVGKDAGGYKLKVTTKDNVESTYVIDASTYYVKSLQRKSKVQGQDVDVTSTFSDYRKTDAGYVVPYAIDIDFGQFQLSIAVKKVELNKPIDPAVFAMPKATT